MDLEAICELKDWPLEAIKVEFDRIRAYLVETQLGFKPETYDALATRRTINYIKAYRSVNQ